MPVIRAYNNVIFALISVTELKIFYVYTQQKFPAFPGIQLTFWKCSFTYIFNSWLMKAFSSVVSFRLPLDRSVCVISFYIFLEMSLALLLLKTRCKISLAGKA